MCGSFGQTYENKDSLGCQTSHESPASFGGGKFNAFLETFEDGIIFDLAREIGIDNPVAQCQRRITSGDGIWLRDKETATDDLKKLVVDYRIIVESQNFGISGKSFNGCVQSWQAWCRFNFKIPVNTIGDIAQSKREIFLSQLVDNAAFICEATSEPLKVLREKYSYQLEGLSEDEIKELYAALPYSSFTDLEGHYRKNLQDLAKRIQSNQLKNNEVHNELEKKFPSDAYQWYPSVRVKDIIEKFAENKYYTGEAHDKVTEQVMRMPDEEAKKLLIELLDKNYEVGLKLLEES